jgi:hypothetical protein
VLFLYLSSVAVKKLGLSDLATFWFFLTFIGFKYERVPRKVIEGWIYSKVSQYFDEGCDSLERA